MPRPVTHHALDCSHAVSSSAKTLTESDCVGFHTDLADIGRWVAYGVATSRDGVRWSDKGDMLYASLGGEQQSCSNGGYALGSGWVWQDPATEKWLLDFSESTTDRVRADTHRNLDSS